MSLQPVSSIPGLWRDPTWTHGAPGVYAVIVGASVYPHLDGGSAPAPDTHQLGQLVSSATTAARVFEWVSTAFMREDMGVVWCHLLLSPTPGERAKFEEDQLFHYVEPNNDNLRKAIQRWASNVPTDEVAVRNSRTLFFFSGHGVQSNGESLLLPSDYLDPEFGAPQYENCVSVDEMWRWMSTHPAAEHLALLDACRNEFSPLADKGASAHRVFPSNPRGKSPRTAARLCSASSDTTAYQLPDSALTFFGQALIDGLSGLAVSGTLDHLEFLELADYVKPRVNQLLKEANLTTVQQTARQTIDGDHQMVVTEIARSRAIGLVPGEPLPPVATLAAGLESRFDPSLSVKESISLEALAGSSSEAFERFGHEHASYLWLDGVHLRSLSDGSALDSRVDIIRVDRDPNSNLVRVDILLPETDNGVLLVFEGAPNVHRERLAIPLPTDLRGQVPIRLTLTISAQAPQQWPKLQKVDARLGPSDPHSPYGYVWQLTSESELGSLVQAAKRAEPDKLVSMVAGKRESPTAAVAGALLLARAGMLQQVKDWPRNLMKWFPRLPDGAVLWAEALRDAVARGFDEPYGVLDPTSEMIDALGTLATRGLPFFADTVELAQSLTRRLSGTALTDSQRDALARVEALLDHAAQIGVASGNFTAFAGLPRPDFLPGQGVLSVEEIRRLVRP